jgi:mannose-6-phosphate isomerase-like protein (cupin superfamily)
MNVQKYIDSGVLEEYCLGLLNEGDQAFLIQMTMLYPEIKDELSAIDLAMERWAVSTAVQSGSGLKERVPAGFGFGDSDSHLNYRQFTAINKNADHHTWLRALNHLIPGVPSEDFVCLKIKKDDHLQQVLVITKTDFPGEERGDYLESFFILKGRCECTVGNSHFKLAPGDFLEIPSNVKHAIKIISPYVVAILQYQW